MSPKEILGKVAASYLRDNFDDSEEGTARFLLDCLTAEQTAAVAKAVLGNPELSPKVEIKLPKHFLENLGLPEEVLTKERTTYYRNAACSKPALLVANVGDDEQQSLKELVPIGQPQLQNHPETWVKVAAANSHLSEDHMIWWERSLKGLIEAKPVSLDQFSNFVAATLSANSDGGHPIKKAIGYSLPELHLPRDTNFFESLDETTSRHTSRWKALFNTAIKRRSCFLYKQTPSQGLLEKDKLNETFEKVKDSIPEEIHPVIEEYIEAPSGWNEQAKRLAECEWEDVLPLFDGLKREKFNLGKATRSFFEDSNPEALSEDDQEYLERLEARRTTESNEEDESFYQEHSNELKEDVALKAKWDKFIFGNAIEAEDLFVGLAQCFQFLFDQNLETKSKTLSIRSDKRFPKDLRQLNTDAGLYFSFRYKELSRFLGGNVKCEFGELFNYEDHDKKWRESGRKGYPNRSKSKNATQIKFYLELEAELLHGSPQTFTTQLVWKFNPSTIASELRDDWQRLAKKPFIRSQTTRESVSGKGRFQTVALDNVATLQPSYDKDRGSLVPVYEKGRDVELLWRRNLKQALDSGLITKETFELLGTHFDTFSKSYTNALHECMTDGLLATDSLLQQFTDYSSLLESVFSNAQGDRNSELLLRPLLYIGVTHVHGGPITAIVAPWHPLRLAAFANKSLIVSKLMRQLMSSSQVYFGDTRLYFSELVADLNHVFYPEVIVAWDDEKPELLTVTDNYLGYSLHEPPIAAQDSYADTNENPIHGANRILEILKRYLSLHPHEQANLSVVLYNCDSARLPQTIVDKVQELHEDDGDLRCQVVLRHRDGTKLRQLYESIIESSGSDIDSYVASEASSDFMARLRIGIMADQAPPPDEGDGPPIDVVFLQDVIARHAQLDWYPETTKPIPVSEWVPQRWSKRRPAAKDDLKSVVYLSSPVAPVEGWNYLTAITTFFRPDWDQGPEKRLIPARQLNFRDPTTKEIFEEIHNLGNWVVNYDELLDRRQLLNQNVKVIRYKQTGSQGRNTLISSNCSTSLLKRMVRKRLDDLSLGLSDVELQGLTQRLIDEANLISGDLVLRAARRGRNASELIGVVLSKFLIENEVGTDQRFGWYFLDDYANWLGQKEEHIADILTLSPEFDDNGKKRLSIVITESKYIDYSNLSAKKKESQKQLRQTVERIAKALFGNPSRLDRDIWLSRFSDMLLSGVQYSEKDKLDLSEWRRAIRAGECSIYLRGYSHVFISGPSDCPECSSLVEVQGCESSYQEVFSRAKVRELLLKYLRKDNPTPTRIEISGTDIWTNKDFSAPSKDENEQILESETATAETKDEVEESESRSSKEPTATSIEVASEAPSPPAQRTSVLEMVANLEADQPEDEKADLEWLKETESRAKSALQQFQLRSKLLNSSLTPNAAILKFEGSADLTVEKVIKRRSEFLTTHGLNLISVRAEPGIVSISVAREKRKILYLSNVWKSLNFGNSEFNCDLLVGLKEEDGSPLFVSPLKNAPHTLIAGATGSGKSVLIQNIILSIAATNSSRNASIVLIDPKRVDFNKFKKLPHVKDGVIKDKAAAVQRLTELVEEMEKRYQIFEEQDVSNISELKKKNVSIEMPVIWVIHDELALWMMDHEYSEQITNAVNQLAVAARAAGIFLIFGAQRPDNTVVPMQLRSNLGNRLVLRVDGEGTSEIALTEKGAEKLLGNGHLLAKLEGEQGLIYAQVPFASDEQISSQVLQLAKR
ncbi:FtsK/SpoIIIE domain-containing protein [Pelagicoccus sp. SDUM812003]|uniref:FtsK/SpoIIIE domain-containing protein n=1 Tax=Pelagicoccus sp. SDUM812003 TaxID=3041267 RepID=UPI00280CC0A1|nr:FtsK/SpoIIIE domain-containing protein [Pelagicoccus sp. SDUM812003]MDQ8203345.1 FtsK/SpoIIIE domain-containing protein [Pelagicoccus sp. SDUM812003]